VRRPRRSFPLFNDARAAFRYSAREPNFTIESFFMKGACENANLISSVEKPLSAAVSKNAITCSWVSTFPQARENREVENLPGVSLAAAQDGAVFHDERAAVGRRAVRVDDHVRANGAREGVWSEPNLAKVSFPVLGDVDDTGVGLQGELDDAIGASSVLCGILRPATA